MSYLDSTLWKATLAEQEGDLFSESRKQLRDCYRDLREKVELLVENVSADLRQYTVHDITHLDALWGIGSEIAGPEYLLTPTEAFVLGSAFLLHDAGMWLAAYPKGIVELEKSRQWLVALRKCAI